MDMSPKLREVHVPRSTRLVLSGQYTENRERYLAQSKMTVNGKVADLPTLHKARKVNQGG